MNLKANIHSVQPPSEVAAPEFAMGSFSIVDLIRIFRTRLKLILGVAIVFLIVVAVVTFQLTPLFKGEALVILDPRKNNVTDVNAILAGLPGDQVTVQNQIQILQSRSLLDHVVDKAGLLHDAEFDPTTHESLFAFLAYLNPSYWFGEAVLTRTPQQVLQDERNLVIDKLLDRMQISAVGLSQAIEIAVSSEDAQKAALITNAVAESYVQDQLNAKFEATQTASKWLADRLAQLSAQVQAADAAVAQYKADNNLTETTGGGSVVDQQLGDLNSQLIIARSNLAEQQAKYSGVRNLMRSGSGASASAVVDSPLIATLRGQETELLRQEADLLSRYGPRHPKVIDVESQKRNILAKIAEEVNRVIQSVGNEVSVAQARVSSLEASVRGLAGQAGTQNQARVKLKQLEANASSTRGLYDAFLSRFKETQDQADVQAPDARVLSRAEAPQKPSFPPKLLIFGFALPFSLFLGFSAALLAERLDNGFRSTSQIEQFLHLPVLATVPEVAARGAGDKRSAVDIVVDKPLSAFSEAIRSIHLGLTLAHVDRPAKVVLVTSAIPGEGKTTVAVSLARLAARTGKKVILVEGDLRQPNVAALLGRVSGGKGLIEAVTKNEAFEECLQKDPRSDAYVLASGAKAASPPDVLSSAAVANMFAALRRSADLIIIDSAPVLPVNDTRILAPLADSVVFVVRWERTPRQAAVAALRELTDVQIPIAGVVMTRTDMRRSHFYSYGQMYSNYSKYYTE